MVPRTRHPRLDPFCLRAHHLQAQIVQRRLNNYAALWQALEELATQRGLPDRTVTALFTAARGTRVRRTTYQHDATLTEGQAVRDLRLLTHHNLLHPHGETKSRHYTPAPPLTHLAHLAHQVTTNLPSITEPYRPFWDPR